MNQQLIDTVVQAVLYDGHTLFPGQAPTPVGRVYPGACHAQDGAESCRMQTECLVEGPLSARVEIIARFLQATERDIGALAAPLPEMPALDNPDFFHIVGGLQVEGRFHQSGQEAVERTIPVPVLSLGELCAHPQNTPFSFAPTRAITPILDRRQHIAGVIVRRQEAIGGVVEISAQLLGDALVKVTVRIVNLSILPAVDLEDADEVAMRTFAATHTLLHAHGAEFVSLIDPPGALAQAAASCRNLGTWPVLIGDKKKKERATVLSSPITLYDYPRIAVQSPDDFFDQREIDEIPALAGMTTPELVGADVK